MQVNFLSKKLLLISLSLCRTAHFIWEGGVYQRQKCCSAAISENLLSQSNGQRTQQLLTFYSGAQSQWLCCTLWSQTLLSSCIAETELPWKMQGQHYRWQKGTTADFLEAAAVCWTAHLPFTSNLCPWCPQKRLLSSENTVQISHISTVTKMELWMMHLHLYIQTDKKPNFTASPFFFFKEKTTGSHFTGLSPSLSYYLQICTTKMRAK